MFSVVGIGAGLVSALLFSVVVTGSPLGVLLYSAAPLPIFIASLGWNHRSGLAATAAGALAVAVVLTVTAGIAFAIIVALPAWWIAYLALLARGNANGGLDWYPLGGLLLWIAGTAALVTVGSALIMTTDYEVYRTFVAGMIERLLGDMVKSRLITLGPDTNMKELSLMLAPVVPVGIGASFVTTIAANLWVAAKTVQVSGRLPRPWPFIPGATIPRRGVLVLIAALVVSGFGGFAGVAGAALSGAMFAIFMFSGLTTLHDLSRGRPLRGPMLVSLYVALLLMQAVLTPVLALVGIADSLLRLRSRRALPPPDPET